MAKRQPRVVTHDDVQRIDRAADDLQMPIAELNMAGAKQAAKYVRAALKSVQGASRHANSLLKRTTT